MDQNRGSRRALRWALGAAAVLLAGAAAAASLRAKPVPVEVAAAAVGAFRVTVDEEGRTRVKDRYLVSAPISGQLGRITLHAGDDVAAGAPLARIHPVMPPLLDARARAELEARVRAAEAMRGRAEATLAAARAVAAQAGAERARARALAAAESLAPQTLERAELDASSTAKAVDSAVFGVRIARHELELARAALLRSGGGARAREAFEVGAPVAGRVLRVLRESEGVVAAGTPLLELGDPAALEVVVDLLTTDAAQLGPGARAELGRYGGGPPLRAHVRRVEPSATTKRSALGVEEQRVDVLLELDEPRERWSALQDGYSVEARLEVYARAEALYVPAGALFRARDRWWVYVVRDGRARRTAVEVGRTNGVEAEIAAGLEPRARVVAYPDERISEGARVSPLGDAE